jgi:hypothetical protein
MTGAGCGHGGVVRKRMRAVRADDVGGVAGGVVDHGQIDLRVAAEGWAAAHHLEVTGAGGFAFEGGGLERGGDGFGHGRFLAFYAIAGKVDFAI